MYKIIQVHEGANEIALTVKKSLTVVVVVKDIREASITLSVSLDTPGASATITGIVIGQAKANIALHTMQYHSAPDTTSDLLIGSVLSGDAHFLYDGGIVVSPGAQKTNAYQRNENILLSSGAFAQSKPSLEILADDVRCTHGATTAPLDDDALWYLSLRGISRHRGIRLLTDGFINHVLMHIGDRSIMSKLCETTFPNLKD